MKKAAEEIVDADVGAEDVARIDFKLDTLMKKWIELWRRAGGVKAMCDR
jgi:hypothetical protein